MPICKRTPWWFPSAAEEPSSFPVSVVHYSGCLNGWWGVAEAAWQALLWGFRPRESSILGHKGNRMCAWQEGCLMVNPPHLQFKVPG